MKKIKELDALATEMVGDGKKPNVFFVTHGGKVTTVTRHFELAHREWQKFATQRMESALEDRRTGTIASADVDEETKRFVIYDDSITFKFMKKDGSYK